MWRLRLLRKIAFWITVLGTLIAGIMMISGIIELYALWNYTAR